MDVARDAVEVLVRTGRAVPCDAWVGRLARRAERARSANLPHNRM